VQGAVDDSVRFELLGPLRARRGPDELDLGPGRQQAVLAVLLLAANHAVQPGEIVDQVWGDDPPENGINVVQKYVAGLRRVLEPDRAPRAAAQLLTLTPGGYCLSVAPGELDLDDFAGHVHSAARLRALGRLDEATAEIRTALALWRSEPLTGLTGKYFDATRAQLVEDRAAALEDWAELELEQGHEVTLLPELSRLIGEYPLRQRLRGAHLLALYRTGRQAEALTSYQEARSLLVANGIQPDPALQNLHSEILRNSSALTRPTTAVFLPLPNTPSDRRPLGWRGWTLKVVAALVPLVTVALGAGPLMALLAARRRSRWLGVEATVYFVVTIIAFAILGSAPEDVDRVQDVLAFIGVLATVAACSVHAALIVPLRPKGPDVERDVRRQQAREIVARHPQVARELGIGRPDLPNRFDDGGLIDLNDAPESVLKTLPGVPPEHAALIIAERNQRGPFRSLEDAVARGVFSWPLPPPLAGVVVVIPVQDSLEEERR
jgi:DNA-binding SARP family transcriptional activator